MGIEGTFAPQKSFVTMTPISATHWKLLWHILPVCTILFFSACEKDKDAPLDGPFIETAGINENNQLDLKGQFGEDPGENSRTVLVDNVPLTNDQINQWQEANILCRLDSEIKDQITVEVVSKGKKSNAKVVKIPSNKIRINYLQVWEADSKLYIYGENFGWEKRSITVKGVPVTNVLTWAPNLIVCTIPRITDGSFGDVVVSLGSGQSATKRLYRWRMKIDYTFPQSGINGNLLEEATFYFTIRGDIEALPNQYIPNHFDQIYLFSFCDFKMSGSGQSTYEDCNQVHVSWDEILGSVDLSPNSAPDPSGSSYFRGQIHVAPDSEDAGEAIDGFDVMLDLNVVNATTSHRTYTSCDGTTSQETVPQMIDFVTFSHNIIPLRFQGTSIAADTIKKEYVAPTSGLIWDQADYYQNLSTVTLHWAEIKAEW